VSIRGNVPRIAAAGALLAALACFASYLAHQRTRYFSLLDAQERHQRAVAANDRALELSRRRDFKGAAAILEQADSLDPGEPVIRANLAFAYGDLCFQRMMRAQYGAAREDIARALSLCDSAAVLWYIKADLCNRMNQADSAAAAVAMAQRLGGLAPAVQDKLERLQRDLAAQAGFQSGYSGYFEIRFDGVENRAFADQVLAMLEGIREQVGRDLGWQVRTTTSVILYTSQQFADVTRLPSWVGAAFDGKIRVPMAGYHQDSTTLRTVLAHEFTHAALFDMTGNRCPAWFNEGLAQLEEGRAAAAVSAPLAQLSLPFSGMKDDQARLAYAASLSAVSYLAHAHDMGFVRILLEKIRGGQDFAAAFAATYDQTPSEFERQWQQSVAK
jgi:hypothetical protein